MGPTESLAVLATDSALIPANVLPGIPLWPGTHWRVAASSANDEVNGVGLLLMQVGWFGLGRISIGN